MADNPLEGRHTGEFDILRGFAIWIVVFAHNAFYQIQSFNSASLELAFTFLNFFSVAMPIFFFITGYFSVRVARRNTKHFILSRLRLIGIPYLVWSTFYILMEYFLRDTINFYRSFSLQDIIGYYLLGNAVDEYYFIFVLVIFYLLTPFLVKIPPSKFKFLLFPLFILMMLFSVLYYVPNYFGIHWISTFWTYRNPFTWLFFYAWGIWTFDSVAGSDPYWRKSIPSKTIVLCIVLYILSFIEFYFMPYKYENGIPLMAPIGLAFAAVFIPVLLRLAYIMSQKLPTISKIFGDFGKHTLGIYLSNGLIEGFLLGLGMILYPSFRTKSSLAINLLLFAIALSLSFFLVKIVWKLSKKVYALIF